MGEYIDRCIIIMSCMRLVLAICNENIHIIICLISTHNVTFDCGIQTLLWRELHYNMMLDIVMGDSEKILKGALLPWIRPQLSIIIYHACLNAYS